MVQKVSGLGIFFGQVNKIKRKETLTAWFFWEYFYLDFKLIFYRLRHNYFLNLFIRLHSNFVSIFSQFSFPKIILYTVMLEFKTNYAQLVVFRHIFKKWVEHWFFFNCCSGVWMKFICGQFIAQTCSCCYRCTNQFRRNTLVKLQCFKVILEIVLLILCTKSIVGFYFSKL